MDLLSKIQYGENGKMASEYIYSQCFAFIKIADVSNLNTSFEVFIN